jgi:L-threonylcarbamoyladenylate synthase
MIALPFVTPEQVEAALAPAVRHLRAGGIIGYPTETVYGIGCALDADALARLAALKRTGVPRPFLLLVTGAAMAPNLLWTLAAERLAAHFWPGPLTLVLRATAAAFPREVRGAEDGVAVRSTPHAGMRALIDALGAPITSSSANVPGSPPATDAAETLRALRALGAPDDALVLDGGALPPSASSTLIDCTASVPRVLRVGALDIERIAEVVEVLHE